MFGLGMGEGLIILAIVILLFGGSKLPQLGSALGKALTNFKQGMKEGDDTKKIDDKK
ncbi:MAG: twin-arginine translocase TatA/TatE family subunit [Bdellovibrio sp. CG12_big_fil_rev_8_21_14_0_65_39_13]|nr:MAG: twin-arginine translocase TatA/TatE family subunit [Bdellovibrio sp. CG22_combo_CG10-13_8_21_14_all_39_27]PIQ61303.1 MAG: twin-arginine translocase TatA/TatE family subunit [Bdellovibrio sp. CG12_big_fil_rev_8_21_14_0_65_39_13]PIR33612.1 MAG: twin-arginine translocase TatA/TatE family subunit [Bdellovibrio sp. CG11_big_fil_rev_8_21_14_0_20_39_38]PJB52581.1 MAG: twin-arginine translocase TatA/TatE family subunit [Bdellovibrio sp. CG_4_9_14_3_um_filter_39_7]